MNEMSYAQVYRLAVREARRVEEAQIRRERERDDARIAGVLAANGGKPFPCKHPSNVRACIRECVGCCTHSYIPPREEGALR